MSSSLISPTNTQVQLLFVGTHKRDERVRNHAHFCSELIFIRQGTCDVNTDNGMLHASQGDVIYIPARQVHDQVSDSFIETIYCGFTGSHRLQASRPQVFHLADTHFVSTCMQLLVHSIHQQTFSSAYNAIFHGVLEYLSNLLTQEQEEKHIPLQLKTAMRYIKDHLDQPLTIDKLAEAINMSTSNLHLLFRTHLETSPIRYLHNQRMRAAETCLQSPYLSIKEISHICGYQDVNHFIRRFRESHGLPPGKWREQSLAIFD
ncbi:helix-turn-helix domain-containing protein [Poriferisphaera sp. WC338]|uniref:helix-turn-helix domain-containing protein n=1 Tax=Poriferisphaera sp. WC338 TaxID=3425129 RepID=UPI003D81B8FE